MIQYLIGELQHKNGAIFYWKYAFCISINLFLYNIVTLTRISNNRTCEKMAQCYWQYSSYTLLYICAHTAPKHMRLAQEQMKCISSVFNGVSEYIPQPRTAVTTVPAKHPYVYQNATSLALGLIINFMKNPTCLALVFP